MAEIDPNQRPVDAATPPEPVYLWVDPTCPWAWQTSVWLRRLRDDGLVSIKWALFSLEIQAMPDSPFEEIAVRGGEALRALVLVRSEDGQAAFEHLYDSIGTRMHAAKERISPEMVRAAAAAAGLPEAIDRAVAVEETIEAVRTEHETAVEAGVFGVPTIQIEGTKPMFGPVFALAPEGEDVLTVWEHVRWLAARDDFYELKRWRDRKPGTFGP